MQETTSTGRKHRVLLNTMISFIRSNGTDQSVISFLNSKECRPIQLISEMLGDKHRLVTYKGNVHPYLHSGDYANIEINGKKLTAIEIGVLESARMFQDSVQCTRRSLRQNHGVNVNILTQLCKDWKGIIHDLNSYINK